MNNVICTLEGVSETENPSISEIERELRNLNDRRCEFVLLSKGLDFIQCMRDRSICGYFRVSANIKTETQGVLLEYT